MTSQLLTRIPTELKKQFEAQAKEQGLSMNYLITILIRTYTKNPRIVQTYVDDEAFDAALEAAWSDPRLG